MQRPYSPVKNEPIRFAVVGLGYLAQTAVLPAFSPATGWARLTALISRYPDKLHELGDRYAVPYLYPLENYDSALAADTFDAVYITAPNALHCDLALRAAIARKHVLVEPPLGLTSAQCLEMIRVTQEHHVRLMVGYRLHFDRANMRAVAVVRSGEIGAPRIVSATVTLQLDDGNGRTDPGAFGGLMHTAGILGINAARYIFRSEPQRVTALTSNPNEPRFRDTPGLSGAILDFGGGRLATIAASYAAARTSHLSVIGTCGTLELEPAFEFPTPRHLVIRSLTGTEREHFPTTDQFAPELIEFARCITEHDEPETSGLEGLADVRIIEAIERSCVTGRTVELPDFKKPRRPDISQTAIVPPAKNHHPLINARAPERR